MLPSHVQAVGTNGVIEFESVTGRIVGKVSSVVVSLVVRFVVVVRIVIVVRLVVVRVVAFVVVVLVMVVIFEHVSGRWYIFEHWDAQMYVVTQPGRVGCL